MAPVDRDASRQARVGTSMAVTAMVSVQLGAAAAVAAAPWASPEGLACLRLTFAGALLLAAVRPWRAPLTRSSLVLCLWLGVTTAAMNMLFIAAIFRLPLGTASALEFIGPLSVALTRQRSGWPGRIMALVAAAGV